MNTATTHVTLEDLRGITTVFQPTNYNDRGGVDDSGRLEFQFKLEVFENLTEKEKSAKLYALESILTSLTQERMGMGSVRAYRTAEDAKGTPSVIMLTDSVAEEYADKVYKNFAQDVARDGGITLTQERLDALQKSAERWRLSEEFRLHGIELHESERHQLHVPKKTFVHPEDFGHVHARAMHDKVLIKDAIFDRQTITFVLDDVLPDSLDMYDRLSKKDKLASVLEQLVEDRLGKGSARATVREEDGCAIVMVQVKGIGSPGHDYVDKVLDNLAEQINRDDKITYTQKELDGIADTPMKRRQTPRVLALENLLQQIENDRAVGKQMEAQLDVLKTQENDPVRRKQTAGDLLQLLTDTSEHQLARIFLASPELGERVQKTFTKERRDLKHAVVDRPHKHSHVREEHSAYKHAAHKLEEALEKAEQLRSEYPLLKKPLGREI